MGNVDCLDHKVGIMILNGKKLENVFPMYRSLRNKIEECRAAAAQQMRQPKKKHYQYNFMYDNVFSILGKRGTGKTSVAFTLKERIEEDMPRTRDVVLPIIIPEVIPENCSILGWILAIVKEEVEHLELELKELRKAADKGSYWDTCRYSEGEEEESLSRKLDSLSKMFFAGKYNPANENSYYKAVGNSAVQAEDYYQFAHEIAELWDLWIKALCRLEKLKNPQNSEENKEDICPLIYFIFDDVDLAPEKIDELLSVIIKYLSHPNIIVITTADEELFLEVIENRLDKSIGRLPKEWRTYLSEYRPDSMFYFSERQSSKEWDRDLVSETARMYLGKVMPPSTRYYLRLFHTALQKEHFWLKETQNLGESVRMQVQRLLAVVQEENRPHCFMGEEKRIINFYMNFFGDTSRQIGNVYLGIKDLMDNLLIEVEMVSRGDEIQERYLSNVYECCRYFISLVIHTNQNLGSMIENVDSFVDEALMTEYGSWKLYVNYAYLNEFLRNYSEIDMQKNLAVGLQLYSLMAFVENILLILEFCTSDGVTGRKRVNVVRPFAEYINENVFDGRYVFRDDFTAEQFFGHYSPLLSRLNEILANKELDKKLEVEFFYSLKNELYEEEALEFKDLLVMYQRNRRWTREMTGMIAMVYGNAYLIDRKLLENCIGFGDEACRMGYQVYAGKAFTENVKRYMESLDLYEQAYRFVEQAKELTWEQGDEAYRKYLHEINSELQKELEEQRAADVEGNGVSSYISLATLLRYIEDQHTEEEGVLNHCPTEILDEMGEVLGDGLDVAGVQELLQKELARIEDMEKEVHCVNFYAPENWLVVLQELEKYENPTIRRNAWDINQMIGLTFEENSELRSVEQFVVQVEYRNLQELKSLFGEIIEDLKLDEVMMEKVQALYNDLDMAIDLNDSIQSENAVNLALHLVFVKYLQRLYLSLSILPSYEVSYLSAKNLQWMSGQKGQKETYYYQLYKVMKETAAGTVKCTERQQKNKEELQYMIGKITRSQRRRYVDKILGER